MIAPLVLALALAQLPAPPKLLPGVRASTEALDVIVVTERQATAGLLRALPSGFALRRTYATLPAFAGRATPQALEALSRDGRVRAIQLDHLGRARTAESAQVMGAAQTRAAFGLTGRGVTVAVLDTGIERSHPDLDGGVAKEKCFVLSGCAPGNTDTGDLANEGSGHGTHVSGAITGDGVVAPAGIAPSAKLVEVRVFNDAQLGRVSDWAAALDWILANPSLGVRVVNMSLGTDDNYPGPCDAEQPLLAAAIDGLADAGVIVFAASGNDTALDAIGAPACVTNAVSVGATYDAELGREPDSAAYQSGCYDADAGVDKVACFSNSGPHLDLLAPGTRIRAAGLGGGVSEKRGTSQAVPHASAAAALLLELDPSLTVAELTDILKATGKPIFDARNSRTMPRVDVLAATRAVHQSFCGRHADGTRCLLELPCDGGACANGTCAAGACAIVLSKAPALPAASGCSTAAGSVGLFALLVLALRVLYRPSQV